MGEDNEEKAADMMSAAFYLPAVLVISCLYPAFPCAFARGRL